MYYDSRWLRYGRSQSTCTQMRECEDMASNCIPKIDTDHLTSYSFDRLRMDAGFTDDNGKQGEVCKVVCKAEMAAAASGSCGILGGRPRLRMQERRAMNGKTILRGRQVHTSDNGEGCSYIRKERRFTASSKRLNWLIRLRMRQK